MCVKSSQRPSVSRLSTSGFPYPSESPPGPRKDLLHRLSPPDWSPSSPLLHRVRRVVDLTLVLRGTDTTPPFLRVLKPKRSHSFILPFLVFLSFSPLLQPEEGYRPSNIFKGTVRLCPRRKRLGRGLGFGNRWTRGSPPGRRTGSVTCTRGTWAESRETWEGRDEVGWTFLCFP